MALIGFALFRRQFVPAAGKGRTGCLIEFVRPLDGLPGPGKDPALCEQTDCGSVASVMRASQMNDRMQHHATDNVAKNWGRGRELRLGQHKITSGILAGECPATTAKPRAQ